MRFKFSVYNIEFMTKVAVVLIALVIAISTFIVTDSLTKSLAAEERGKMQLWAEATEQLATMDGGCDIKYLQTVITRNTSIPVILLADSIGNVISYRNIDKEFNDDAEIEALAQSYAQSNPPIVIDLGDGEKQYICYGESKLLQHLSYYPIVYIITFLLYALLLVLVLRALKRAEQNRVWVGLTKETAHQLGTPISSLLAWTEILKARYPDDEMIPEMGNDVVRLRTIAERFSQVGSKQELTDVDLDEATQKAVNYMRSRISKKIDISFSTNGGNRAMLNVPLFEWVIENLCKNAADAMEGEGKIAIDIKSDGSNVLIDVSDTGKGIARTNHKRIFYPGYTTKKRGWGLGLSLAKRIVEEYHHGKIYVKHSEPGKGTTFRIELPNT